MKDEKAAELSEQLLDYIPAGPVEGLGVSASRQGHNDGLGSDILSIHGLHYSSIV